MCCDHVLCSDKVTGQVLWKNEQVVMNPEAQPSAEWQETRNSIGQGCWVLVLFLFAVQNSLSYETFVFWPWFAFDYRAILLIPTKFTHNVHLKEWTVKAQDMWDYKQQKGCIISRERLLRQGWEEEKMLLMSIILISLNQMWNVKNTGICILRVSLLLAFVASVMSIQFLISVIYITRALL